MKFNQIDRIAMLEPGKRIEAVRTLVGNEEYLRDHFPRFAVMPGVLMLEALYQASALLVRATEEHRPGLVLLREAKNVKFADFVRPGETLRITAELLKRDDRRFTLRATGHKDERLAVLARLVVECQGDAHDGDSVVDRFAAQSMRRLTEQLRGVAMASG